ncbi:unnamed protein product [Natator depressus]|uniref:uncharacterized protein LOC141995684 n=1 Tax=Natator depressus TaxID=27790 RepID=UPI003D549D9A
MSFLEIVCSNAGNEKTCCSHTEYRHPLFLALTKEKRRTAEAAKQSVLEILRDTLKKNQVLVEKPTEWLLRNNGDPKFWMLTAELVRDLISVLEAVTFMEDLSEKNIFARVYPKSEDKTIYLGPQFWEASKHLAKDSQLGMLIHEASHFLRTDIITYEDVSVDRRGLMETTNSMSLHNANFVPLSGAVLNANIEYVFELTLNHKGKYENAQYSCCGEIARNSVCEKAVPAEFFSSLFNGSLSISPDIEKILKESLLPATGRVTRLLDELREIADAIDKIHKGATIASIAGGTVGIAGGITTIVGLCLAPVTFGASLIVSLTGFAVATAGGLTSAAATTTDMVASKVKKETVEKLLLECQSELEHIKDYTESIAEKIQRLIDYENSGFVFAFAQIGSGAGRTVLNTLKIVKAGQLLATAGRIARFAGAATHILIAVTLGLDVFFVARDSMELHKGAKTELAAKIREAVNEIEQVIGEVNEMCTALTAGTQK